MEIKNAMGAQDVWTMVSLLQKVDIVGMIDNMTEDDKKVFSYQPPMKLKDGQLVPKLLKEYTEAYRQYGRDVNTPAIISDVVGRRLSGLLLCERIHVVGIFHLVEQGDNIFRGEGHAETYGCRCPCLAHGVEHHEVGIFGQLEAQGTLTREVAVCLVD